ncbi:MAG: Ig-like domain-containing protein [Bacilli bacterium]
MKKKIIYIGITLLILIIVTSGFWYINSKKKTDNKIIVENNTIVLKEKANYTIRALTYPKKEQLTFLSQNSDIVSIDNDGNLDTLKEGTAKIKISTKNQSKEINIIVTNNEEKLTNISFVEEKVKLNVNDRYLLETKTYPKNSLTPDLLWTSANENIVKITDGYLEILNPGTSQITVSKKIGDNEISARIIVSVGNDFATEIKSINFEEEIITLGLNETYQLNPIIKPDNASKQIEYKITDEKIISIDKYGIIKAKNKGTTSIIALASNGKSKIIEVKITSKEDGLIINKEELMIAKEETYQLKSNYVSGIEWYSSNNKIVTVDNKGFLKGINNGEAIVTAINNYGRMNTVKINVKGKGIPVEKISINKSEITLQTGKNYQLKAEIIPKNATNKEIIWETMDNRIAQVTDDGMIIGKTEGTTIITGYSSNNKQTIVKINVIKGYVSIDELEINPSSLTIAKGDSYQLKATLIPSNANNKKVIWKSSDLNIVSITEDGLIKANKTGSVIISATSSGISGKAVINVRTSITEISSIDIKESNVDLEIGQTKNLTVTYLPSNASNKSFSWSSNDETVATISNKGLIIGKKEGKASITVSSSNGKKDTIKVNIKKPKEPDGKITNIYINLENVSLQKGETKKLRATILPLNAKQDVTWISDNPNIVSVDSNGLIMANNTGNTIIAAIASDGKIARTKVLVSFPPIYSNKTPILQMMSNNLIVTMTKDDKLGAKIIRVWVADPYKQFHKKNILGNENVEQILNRTVNEEGLSNSIMIGSNASVNYKRQQQLGNLIITNGNINLNNPGGPFNRGANGNALVYYGITSEGILKVYGPVSKRSADEKRLFDTIINDGVKETIGMTFENHLVANAKIYKADTYSFAIRNTLCQVNTNNFIYIVSGNGDTTRDIANLQIANGCVTGVNLDGGGSTNVFYKNKGDNYMRAIHSTKRLRPEAIYFSEF